MTLLSFPQKAKQGGKNLAHQSPISLLQTYPPAYALREKQRFLLLGSPRHAAPAAAVLSSRDTPPPKRRTAKATRHCISGLQSVH